jgi:hypothetical protein
VPEEPQHSFVVNMVYQNPFREVDRFDNDVPVAPLIVDLYLTHPWERSRRWGDVACSGEGSFYTWLNAEADDDPMRGQGLPLVSNLAAYIHRTRPDLQKPYPKPFGADRIGYVRWFINHGREGYDLADEFVKPISESFRRWSVATTPGEQTATPGLPAITNLAAFIHQSRPDLCESFPDLYGANRIAFLIWFLRNAKETYKLDEALIERTREEFFGWAIAPSSQETGNEGSCPMITNLGAHIYDGRPDLKAMWPDLYGRHRIDFSSWYINAICLEYGFDRSYVISIIDSWALGEVSAAPAAFENDLTPVQEEPVLVTPECHVRE